MAALISLEERRRRSRNFVFAALILLVTIWTIKLAFPQSTIISIYSTHYSAPTEMGKYTDSDPIPKSADSERWKVKPEGDSTLSQSFNGTIGSKAAVMVEAKFRSNLIPLILHFGSVLGPTWPIIIYTNAESIGMFSTSTALARYIKNKTVQIRVLPNTILFVDQNAVDTFMTESWMWEDLAPIEHILLFESDSMICANAARSVDDYFDYDFVGSPVVSEGSTGGLSLRRRSTVMRVLENWDWKESYALTDTSKPHEDQWFYKKMAELKDSDGLKPTEGGINFPTVDVAKTFSVASFDFPHPLGVHGVLAWNKESTPALDEWCPEYKLCSIVE